MRGSLTVTALLTAVLVTGCGGDEGGSDEGGSDFADQSAADIAQAAKDAMAGLEGVTVSGTLSSEGQEIEIDMAIGADINCTGSFSTQGATAEILGVDGTVWFKPDAAFWELFAGPDIAPQVISAVGDRWVTLPEDDTSFKPFCDIEEFLGELVDNEEAEYTKGDTAEVDGEDTVEIVSEREGEGASSGYVLVDGDHYLVKIEKTEGADPGTVTFSGFDEQPDVEAPAEDEQIALDDLQQGSY